MTCTNASCCTHGHTNARTAPLRPSCTHTHTCPTTLCPLSPSCTHTHPPQPFVPDHTGAAHTRARDARKSSFKGYTNLPSRQIFLQGLHKSSFKANLPSRVGMHTNLPSRVTRLRGCEGAARTWWRRRSLARREYKGDDAASTAAAASPPIGHPGSSLPRCDVSER